MTTSLNLPAPVLEPVCDLAVTIAAPVEVGATPQGLRRMIPITGGMVTPAPGHSTTRPAVQGRIIPGGADFQLIVGGTSAQLDARYVIELMDGSRVFVQNTALRFASADATGRLLRGEKVDPAEVYFRCQPRFETAAPQWSWLMESQFIGTGVRLPDAVHMRFFRVA
jgi:hypothetical protein